MTDQEIIDEAVRQESARTGLLVNPEMLYEKQAVAFFYTRLKGLKPWLPDPCVQPVEKMPHLYRVLDGKKLNESDRYLVHYDMDRNLYEVQLIIFGRKESIAANIIQGSKEE